MLQVESPSTSLCRGCTAHNIFHVQEILSLICEELHKCDELPALSSLARTCKFLHPTATEILWHELYSLFPFVPMMPADLWEVTEKESKPHLVHFGRCSVLQVQNANRDPLRTSSDPSSRQIGNALSSTFLWFGLSGFHTSAIPLPILPFFRHWQFF